MELYLSIFYFLTCHHSAIQCIFLPFSLSIRFSAHDTARGVLLIVSDPEFSIILYLLLKLKGCFEYIQNKHLHISGYHLLQVSDCNIWVTICISCIKRKHQIVIT